MKNTINIYSNIKSKNISKSTAVKTILSNSEYKDTQFKINIENKSLNYNKNITPKLNELCITPVKKNNIFSLTKEEKKDLITYRNIRSNKFSNYNTVSRVINSFESNNNESNINFENIYYTTIKKKKIFSNKKLYNSTLKLRDENSQKTFKEFNIYRDIDIGFNSQWQKYLIELPIDNDKLSDDEEINCGTEICISNIQEAIDIIENNKHNNDN